MSAPEPIALYVHIPWCIKKCPYCDFNSHQKKDYLPESEYISHLMADLDTDLTNINYANITRPVSSIFVGGGTPSLFSADGISDLLNGIKKRMPLTGNAEITLEANPGTFEIEKFKGFKDAGINRLSIGVQSYQEPHLSALGRVHDAQQAIQAIEHVNHLAFDSFNTDIMHGLPNQSIQQALDDLNTSITLGAPHISWYQLTIEPNTQFHSKPPTLPNDDVLWDIQQQGQQLLEQAGYIQYEISAFCKEDEMSAHNLNYWRYGDYLGIGCGAHGKITDVVTQKIMRTVKTKHPKGYMDLTRGYLDSTHAVAEQDLAFEYFMNRFRLVEPCPKTEFSSKTAGRELDDRTLAVINKMVNKGLIKESNAHWQVTPLGRRYLNDLLSEFI